MTAEDRPCDACNAEAGTPCAWDCIGLAAEVDRLDAALMPDAVRDSGLTSDRERVPAPHCLVCQSITPARGTYVLAHMMTVESSKLYAALHYRAELDAR